MLFEFALIRHKVPRIFLSCPVAVAPRVSVQSWLLLLLLLMVVLRGQRVRLGRRELDLGTGVCCIVGVVGDQGGRCKLDDLGTGRVGGKGGWHRGEGGW